MFGTPPKIKSKYGIEINDDKIFSGMTLKT